MMKFAAARGNVRIAYDVLGTGAPVMLLHDRGASSGFWYDSGGVKACLARGRQVVLVDLRGHGESGAPVDATAYDPIQCSWDMVAVLDDAAIRRADVIGHGVGGRIALCMAAFAPGRVHAVAAGSAHPFAEPLHASGAARAATWMRLLKAKVPDGRATLSDPAPLAVAMESDWPDMSEAVARSRVPVLLFAGKDEPRYSLIASFAEQSEARLIVVPQHATDAAPAVRTAQLLPRILDFLDAPGKEAVWDSPAPGLWSGSWG